MVIGNKGYNNSSNKKRYCYIRMTYFPPYSHGKNEIKV